MSSRSQMICAGGRAGGVSEDGVLGRIVDSSCRDLGVGVGKFARAAESVGR